MLSECHSRIVVFLLASLLVILTGEAGAQSVKLEELHLNRTAKVLSKEDLKKDGFQGAYTGFKWEGSKNRGKRTKIMRLWSGYHKG